MEPVERPRSARVGHDSAEQFTFHWWDHIFNKTASNIDVEQSQDGAQVRSLAEKDFEITNKKPQKGLGNRNMLYGRFIKSATLLSGGEKPIEKPSSSDSSDSGDEDEKLDWSSSKKITDDELIQACGGRTAHKGARHGLTMSAKLARLEEQEREFLAKYGKKDLNCVKEKQSKKVLEDDSVSEIVKKRKKKKSKKSRESFEADDTAHETDLPKLKKIRKGKETVLASEVLEPVKTKLIHVESEVQMVSLGSETELQTKGKEETKERKRKKKPIGVTFEEQEPIKTDSVDKGRKRKLKRQLKED
ncbi:G patch domain-containing protein 4 isoform X2 [Ambystoma mexicanum]|uniref:G patch domain-containing protein 4 isoform X2 n=1 Tax=Ambystoma mexicanum TaxID=8296 RepID=UPI0037E911EB